MAQVIGSLLFMRMTWIELLALGIISPGYCEHLNSETVDGSFISFYFVLSLRKINLKR